MKKILLLTGILTLSAFSTVTEAKTGDIDSLFLSFSMSYNAGDLIQAEEILISILESQHIPDDEYRVAVYNNLGVINQLSGRYENAITFFDKAEALVTGKKQYNKELADIYTNKGYLYYINRSFDLSVSFYEKSIRIYNGLDLRDKNILQSLSSAYLNSGITHLNTGQSDIALGYFDRSLEIKLQHQLPGSALVYLNMAKAQTKLNDPVQADKLFKKSIETFILEFDEDYYRLAEVYFDYGLFLNSAGRIHEALEVLNKALAVCQNNYGVKHTFTALSYKHLGDHYSGQKDYISALKYYQQSLISVVKDFNDPDIFSNPAVDSSLFDIRLLENLKSKARALELLARQQGDTEEELRTVNKSLETIELALKLIRRIRNSYPTEESRLYLAENEKETYLFAVHIAGVLSNKTGDRRMVCRMYTIAQEAKAALLRNDLIANELIYSIGVPDSIIGRRNTLVADISAYTNLIFTEAEKINPDSIKISFWKDAIFDMTREIEKITAEINISYPQFHELLIRTEPLELSVIQKNLGRDVTLVDYLLSNKYENNKRDLYTFLITRDKITFYSTGLDSAFLLNAGIIRNVYQDSLISKFRSYTAALNYMYKELIKPVEHLFSGNRLMIIPDEEMEWLPFEAFLAQAPGQEQADYEGLQYLINEFAISYAYSSSFISGGKNRKRGGAGVYAFSPDYGGTGTLTEKSDSLPGAAQEIGSIYRWFRGKRFTGDNATETNFREFLREPVLFHLAMHSVTDTTNSKYSYLLFGNGTDNNEDGKLYNYEISLARMSSPMVVLSACNSGTGTLYHGEGLMSLARGFILAGASSVIRTSWEVNDETSAKIVSRFYYYLSKGKYKDEALRQAKLDYIKAAPPAFSSPWYWAAYEILGDNSPVAANKGRLFVVAGISLLITLTVLLIYLRRRNNFSEGSL